MQAEELMRMFEGTRSELPLSRGGQQGRGNNVNRIPSPPSSSSDMDMDIVDTVTSDSVVVDKPVAEEATTSSNDPGKKENEILKEQVVKMKECVGSLSNKLQTSLKNLEAAGSPSTGSVKDFLTCYQHLKQTLFASYYSVDKLDLELRAEDVYRLRHDPDPEDAKYETITLEEMADYFFKLLALGFFLREESSAPWRSNLVAYHLRISRILNFYMVGRNLKKTEANIVNLIKFVGAQTSKFRVPDELLVGLTDHIKRFHERALVDGSIVIYDHCTQGFKGFSRSIDAILRKIREIRYKAHGMTAPARDSEGKGYSFENDLEILWEISDKVFENPAEPYKAMSAEALTRIRD